MSRFLSGKFNGSEPYVPGEQPRGKAFVKLNTNESPFPPSPSVFAALSSDTVSELNLYSDPAAKPLVESIAEYYGRTPDEIFVGNGSDEVLAFIFNAFCDGKTGMACPEIGYGFYPVFCKMLGVNFVPVKLNEDFSIDAARFKGLKENITIANPNAQTGLYMPVNDIKTIVSENIDRLIVIDEAYIDFGGASAVELLNDFDNLIVVGTLSKSRQLAGARIGFAIASQALVADLNKMKYGFNPYNVGSLGISAGAAAFKDVGYFEETRAVIIKNRERLKTDLKDLGFNVTDSLANFVLASLPGIGGGELYSRLKEKGVLVRFLGDVKLKNYVRITVGNGEQLAFLLDKIREIKEETGL